MTDQPKSQPESDGSLDLRNAHELRERLAEYAHSAWSGWMRYLFSKCYNTIDGRATIPIWAVDRWTRQSETEYAALPEEEKRSDRQEADKMLAVIKGAINYDEPVVVITVFDGTTIHRMRYVIPAIEISAFTVDHDTAAKFMERARNFLLSEFMLDARLGSDKRR